MSRLSNLIRSIAIKYVAFAKIAIMLLFVFALAACGNGLPSYTECENLLVTTEPQQTLQTQAPTFTSPPPQEFYENNENTYELCPTCGVYYIHELLRKPTPPLHIRDVEHFGLGTSFLYQFENTYEVTYLQFETEHPATIAIWTDLLLFDFSFVSLDVAGHDWYDGQLAINTQEVLLTIPQLLPYSDVVVLNFAFAHYLLPHGAIVFTDDQNVRWRMFIHESMRGGCFPVYTLGAKHEYPLFPEIEMSDLGRQVAKDFLMQFPSIFMYSREMIWSNPHEVANTRLYFPFPQQLGREMDDGRFRVWDRDLMQVIYTDTRLFHIGYQFGETYTAANGRTEVSRELILTEYVPDVFFRTFDVRWYGFYRHGFYDSNLNRIENANWMLHGVQYATGFRLWDFNQDGIPEIEILYWGDWMGVWPTSPNNSLFVFDGYEYRRVAISVDEEVRAWQEEHRRDMYEWVFVNDMWLNMISDNIAFLDQDGNLVFRSIQFEDEYVRYFHVVFLGSTVEFEQIAYVHFHYAPSRCFHEEHYIPGTDIFLTPVRELTRQQREMHEAIITEKRSVMS